MSFAVILPPKREKSNIRLPVLDQHAQFIVRMDQRVGIFLKFGPACVDLRGRLSQKPVCLRLRVLYDLISCASSVFCTMSAVAALTEARYWSAAACAASNTPFT